MIQINDYISYIPSSDNPLSSNVFFVKGNKNTYIYDVGSNEETLREIEKIDNKIIIISHFHEDHFANIKKINCDQIYLSNYSFKHCGLGNIVTSKLDIKDDIDLEIIPVSSVHSKGSLVININKEYCLISDLISQNKKFNYSLTCMMKQELEKIETEYFITGHGNYIYEKNELIKKVQEIINAA